MALSPCLAAIFLFLNSLTVLATAQNMALSTGTPNSPTCAQPRAAIDPAASLITPPLSSAIPKACNTIQLVSSHNGIASTVDTFQLQSFEFNVYNPSYTVYNSTDNSSCPAILAAIINSCIRVDQPTGFGFWGGWLVHDNKNWSISNTIYPKNGLLPSSTPTGSALNTSTSTLTASSGRPTGADTSSIWSYTWQQSGQDGTGGAASTRSTFGSGNAASSRGSQLTLRPPIGTGISIFQSSSLAVISINGTIGTVLASPSSTATSSSSISKTAVSSTSTTSYLPLAAYTLPPSGTTIAPNSPAATDAAVVLGTLLFALAAVLAAPIVVEATADAAAVAEIDMVIAKVEPLFSDLGGTPGKGSCVGNSARLFRSKRQMNPFTGLDKLTSISDITGCADEILRALKANLAAAAPDAALTAALLADLKQLAEKASEIRQNPSQPTNPIQSQPSKSFNSITSSTSSSSANCASCCTIETAVTDGGIAAITPAPSDWDDIDESLKRALPERFARMGEKRMEKRAPTGKPILSIKGSKSNCVLTTPVGIAVTTPAYPGGNEFITSDRNGVLGTLTTISRYYRMTTTGLPGAPSCTPTLTQVDAAAWTYDDPAKATGKIGENDKLSMDHAYENGFLMDFMRSVIDDGGATANGLSCAVINQQMFTTTGCPDNRLAPIFGSFASYDNPDFIAMSAWLNGVAKGWILGPGFDPNPGGVFTPSNDVQPGDNWAAAKSKISRKNGLATNLVMGGAIINAQDTIARMQRTNNRIYKAFMNLDTWLATTGSTNGIPSTNFGWAAKYQSFMDAYMQKRNGQVGSMIPRLLPIIQADINVAGGIKNSDAIFLSQEQNLLDAFYNTYSAASGVDFSITWEWNVNSIKRDEIPYDKRAACPNLSASPSTSLLENSATASAFNATAANTAITTTAGTAQAITSLFPSLTVSGLLIGPTVFCEGLSPGGGDTCMTINAGCYATSPTYNYVPLTTCTGAIPTYLSTPVAPIANSLTSVTDLAAPTTTSTPPVVNTPTPTPAYNPTGASSCSGGSSLCKSNPEMGSMCHMAMARWNDTEIYNAYSSLSYMNGANAAFTDDGCAAFFDCGTNAYPAISGADLKTALGLIGCSVCGNHQLLQTGCVVKLDACNNCQDYINGVDVTPQPAPYVPCERSKC